MVLTWKYFAGKVPSAKDLAGTNEKRKRIADLQKQTGEELNRSAKEMIDALEHFRFREAQFHMMNLARAGNKFLADAEPWKLAKEDMEAVGSILNYALTIVGNLGIAIEPFLPDAAANILKQLNAAHFHNDWKIFWRKGELVNTLKAGHQLNQAELLYRNVEDAEIEKQIARLAGTKPAATSPETKAAPKGEEATSGGEGAAASPIKAEIVFDDFSKLDIRVGRVVAAEKMEKSNKLLKLTIDSGVDTRTILSGIAQHYTPEEMVGRQVTFIANLAPRKMMGIMSQGMILMAEDRDGQLRLILPDKDVEPGSAVS
jgi:methionyl-tRNA synthetase